MFEQCGDTEYRNLSGCSLATAFPDTREYLLVAIFGVPALKGLEKQWQDESLAGLFYCIIGIEEARLCCSLLKWLEAEHRDDDLGEI